MGMGKRSYRGSFIFIASILVLCGVASTAWCLSSDYYGTYAGRFSGDDSGYWVAVISSSENVFLSYSTSRDEGDGGDVSFRSESGTVGNYYGYSEIEDTYINTFVDASNDSVSGTWNNSYSGDSGSLSGSAITSLAYAGSYSGNFSGDGSGSWTMVIDSDGYITGSMTSDEGRGTFEGGCHPDGYVMAIGEDAGYNDFAFFGQISGSSISGGWISETGDDGSFSTGGSSSDGSSSGGSSGGGCFILSLIGE